MAREHDQTGKRPPGAAGHVLVFDSGVGGLTVAGALKRDAPGLTVDYAADTGFFPYGDKSDAALRARLPDVARALVNAARPDAFVIACNTASTLALEEVRAALDIPVIGTVPAIKPAAAATKTGVIGLLATPGTIARAYTDRLIADHAAGVRVVRFGTVELVRLAERYAAGEAVAKSDVAAVQDQMFQRPHGDRIDTVVLACTHFPLVRDLLAEAAPRPVAYIESGPAIARQTLRVLGENASSASTRPARAWTTSEAPADGLLGRALARFGFAPPECVPVDQPEASERRRNGTTSPDVA